MRYRKIMEGYSRDLTRQRYGPEIMKHIAGEMKDHSIPAAIGRFLSAEHEGMDAAILQYFESIDPTSKKAYVPAMARWYATYQMSRVEDAYKTIEAIRLVQKFANKLKNVRPTEMSFSQFLDLGDSLKRTSSKSERAKEEEEEFYTNGTAKLFHNDATIKIVIPKTEDAAKFFGRGTRWCTASENDNMFSEYNEDGPLFCVLFKGDPTRWQFHFESQQFMNERDEELDLDDPKFLSTIELFKPYLVERMTELVNENRTSMFGMSIRFFPNPSPKMQMIATTLYDRAILFIPLPLDKVDKKAAMIAIESNATTWYDEIDLPEWMQFEIIKDHPMEVSHLHNPTPAVQQWAADKRPESIIEMPASKMDPKALDIATTAAPERIYRLADVLLTPELILKALLRDPSALRFFTKSEKLTREAALFAVSKLANTFVYLKGHEFANDPEIQLKAVEQNPNLVSYMPKPSPEVLKIVARDKAAQLRHDRELRNRFG